MPGKSCRSRKAKRVDYLLRYTRDFPIAVVEAKADYQTPGDGLQQAKDYAEILGLKFAYATNGQEIIEFDFITGKERSYRVSNPEELWTRRCAAQKLKGGGSRKELLTPYHLHSGKEPRYYQQIAINRAVEAILEGRSARAAHDGDRHRQDRGRLPDLLEAVERPLEPHGRVPRKPRILFLADRNFLVDDPEGQDLRALRRRPAQDRRRRGDQEPRDVLRHLPGLAEDERRPGLYQEYPPDFFDLIIVDECHRGSARDESNWREILEYFEPAYQLGMTATPLREDNRDTYRYFGNPIYTYSLRQGIDDGFLAPYRVHRVVTHWDAAGWRPSKGELDRYGRDDPRRGVPAPRISSGSSPCAPAPRPSPGT